MGRPSSARTAVGRDALIATARALLNELPPSRLTRARIAEAAGVDPALVRYYFGDLQALLVEALKQMMAEVRAVLEEVSGAAGSPLARLQKRIQALIEFEANNPAFAHLVVELVIRGEDAWAAQARKELTQRAYDEIRALLEEGRHAGELKADLDHRYFYLLLIGASQFVTTATPILPMLFGKNARPADIAAGYARFLSKTLLDGIRA